MVSSKKKSTRHNEGKLKWSLVSYEALKPMIQVLMFGEKEHSTDNWKIGMPYTEVCESLLRHTYDFMNGMDRDKKTKLLQVGHILCNAMFLSFMFLFRKDFDDRRKGEEYNVKKEFEKDEDVLIVECITNKYAPNFIKGRNYKVTEELSYLYVLKGSDGEEYWSPKNNFKPIN